MSGTVFLAVLPAALLHASWNALVKRGADKSVGILAWRSGTCPSPPSRCCSCPGPTPAACRGSSPGGLIHSGYCLFLARAPGGSPLGYYALVTLVNALTPLPVLMRRDPIILRRTLAEPRRILLTGAGYFTAYGIVVWAITQARLPLVTALRETSIVFAVPIGVLVMKERLDPGKLVATVVTLAGAVVIRLAR